MVCYSVLNVYKVYVKKKNSTALNKLLPLRIRQGDEGKPKGQNPMGKKGPGENLP